MKVAIIIRVYSRLEDLDLNLKIIRDTWIRNNYYIIVVSNGAEDGYSVSDDSKALIDKLIILDKNEGHMSGSNQLLHEGIKHIPEDCQYTLILEADTWLYGDDLLIRYISKMEQSEAVWASADWYDKYYSLAVDYAIIKTEYLRTDKYLFNFGDFPECYIANCLRDTNSKYILIKENMPTHVPSYAIKYPYTDKKHRRFYIFPNSKMVTHHVETLKKGMTDKKRYFNIVAGKNYFSDTKSHSLNFQKLKVLAFIHLSKCFLKRSWYSQKQYKKLANK